MLDNYSSEIKMLGVTSRGILRWPFLTVFLGGQVVYCGGLSSKKKFRTIFGWGRRPSTQKSRSVAGQQGIDFIALEDGLLRSFGTGQNFPPLSLVVYEQGIYYDSTQASSLESLLASPVDVLSGMEGEVERARVLVFGHRLSKYNHAPDGDAEGAGVASTGSARTGGRVLVVDQTVGDMSVALGGARGQTFADMLAAAQAENPRATIYVKTHPEVTSGRKGGYLTHVQDAELNGQRTVVLRAAVNPMSLLAHMDTVYVVTSTMGFEALLAGKPVVCFGVPWYAGWGVTDDRGAHSPAWLRRTRKRSVDELFAAAYFHYARYLNPVTHERGSIFDVINWLVLQREMATRMHGASREGRVMGIGFRQWKAANLKPMLGLHTRQVCFASTVQAAEAMAPNPGDTLVCWGAQAPAGLADMARACRARLLHVEDGFVRSVGLGSDLIRPLSLVLDERGIYFDATRPSDLEHMLSKREFGPDDLARAQAVRAFIVQHGITKYNLEPRHAVNWQADGRPVVLVPGQVEDDASIALGCTTVNTNLGLLQAVRLARPEAFIVYKPHPDVLSHNRKGRVALQAARQFADHIEAGVSVVSCIEAADEVHTMTSLTGFDALLRGKKVVTYGQPFYAGWGLTEDRAERAAAFGRRQRRLTLDELVAGALLYYPIYWDWDLKGYTNCEAVLRRIVEQRTALEASGGLHKLRVGWLRRQFRKLNLFVWAMIDWSARRGSNPRPSA
jgi:capsular polysaccharide export protein